LRNIFCIYLGYIGISYGALSKAFDVNLGMCLVLLLIHFRYMTRGMFLVMLGIWFEICSWCSWYLILVIRCDLFDACIIDGCELL
jgi:hypothetical protein